MLPLAGAEAGVATGVVAPRAVPQLRQNLASGRFSAPQLGQPDARPLPQLSQNTAPSPFSWPQSVQKTLTHYPTPPLEDAAYPIRRTRDEWRVVMRAMRVAAERQNETNATRVRPLQAAPWHETPRLLVWWQEPVALPDRWSTSSAQRHSRTGAGGNPSVAAVLAAAAAPWPRSGPRHRAHRWSGCPWWPRCGGRPSGRSRRAVDQAHRTLRCHCRR